MDIERVGVVGCGLMGSGIAEVCARAGADVVVREPTEALLTAGRERVGQSLARAARAGKLTGDEEQAALANITYTKDWGAMADRQLVLEAVTEDADDKLAVYRELDRHVAADDAILASNTSSIPIMKLAMATSRPSQVIGIHFFNPVPVLPLVELVTSLLTSDETVATAHHFATHQLAKQVIRSQDRAGFIVNALLIPYILSAVRMLESGFATADDID